ncbi:MAG: hypothetical protein H6835_04470 [Planctomycetes bacterium]|nr:hypothetical protein [Planctomycetota bacterium]
MNDWEDRIVDSALHELHGSRPPDLSARVVLALQEQARGPLPELVSAAAPRGTSLRWALAAAALVLLGVCVGAFVSRGAPPAIERIVQLDVQLREGGLECVEVVGGEGGAEARELGETRITRHQAPAMLSFAARAGNRLRAVEPSRFQVGPFGEIATGRQTELEVRSMSVSWKQGVFAASSLTVAVVAGVITWHTLNKDGTAMAGEVVHLEARDPAVVSPSSAEELALLRDKVRQLEQQNADLQLQLLREPAKPIDVPVTEPPPPPEPEIAGPVFDDAKYADALAKLDWKLMGEVTNEMAPLLVDLAKAIEDGKEMPMDLIARISELNGKLIAQVPALLKSGLPGSGPNGAYTHPLVSANILAKTLDAAGVGMDQGQRDRIAGLVRMFSIENQAVADSTQELDLQKLAAEAESKDRFYKEVSQLLTPEQQAVMFPEGAQRYEGTSLFHSSLFTRQFVDPVSAANPAEFARSVANTYAEQLGLSDQTSAQIRGVVERMSGADPALWTNTAGPVESELRMMRAGRTEAAMRQQVAIMQEILRTVPMSPEQRQKFVAMRRLFVPLPK